MSNLHPIFESITRAHFPGLSTPEPKLDSKGRTALQVALKLQRGAVVSTPIKPTDNNDWVCEDCGHRVGDHCRKMGGGFRCPTDAEMRIEQDRIDQNSPND